jgi:leucyl/phenylalanyl-tRNA--protein transferase
VFEWLAKALLLKIAAPAEEPPSQDPPQTDDQIYQEALQRLDPAGADATGLVFAGGKLSRPWLLAAYHRGVFPWPFGTRRGVTLAWFSPNPRAVLPLDRFHVPRRLARRLRQGQWKITSDTAFAKVITHCATVERANASGTWITPTLARAYGQLHRDGIAHSVEAWSDGQLVGGIYGVSFGSYFAGESMFHFQADASKAALAGLVTRLRQQGFTLFDIQQQSPHMREMGAIEIPREDFLAQHAEAIAKDVTFGPTGPIEP